MIVTYTNNVDVAKKIADTLLKNHLCACVYINKIITSYWWNKKIIKENEYKIEIETTNNLYNDIVYIIRKIHNYKLCGISYYAIKSESNLIKWIKKNTK